MATAVHQLTINKAHKEFIYLVDHIVTNFVQLDSGEFWAVGTLAFNPKSCKLAVLLAHMNQLWQSLNLPIPAHLLWLTFCKH